MPSRSLIRVSLNFFIVMSLRYFSAWWTDLKKGYVANLSLSDIFVLHSSLKCCIIFCLMERKKGSFVAHSALCPDVLETIRLETLF